jgi:DNA-directed RNA polymerase subunit alpha
LGNALRRVLLSSLDGAAVTSIRIADVQHEFSDIPGVREDVIRVMLQIKQLRMKMFGVDTARLHLEVRGGGVVTAADIITHRKWRSSILTSTCLRWMIIKQILRLN